MKHKYRVMGNVEVTISTVIESEETLTEEEIYEKASREFGGISQLVGNGGYGDRMIGVNGPDDTIMADEQPVFDDFMEEVEEQIQAPAKMTASASEARNAYYRAWRAKNPDKVRKSNQKYWEKKAAEMAASAEGSAQ